LPEDQKKAQRQALADGPIRFFLTRLQQRLEAGGGQYFAGGRLTVADLKVFVWIRHLRSGKLDYIPADLPDRVAARLVAHFERVKGHPGIKAYYPKHGIAESLPPRRDRHALGYAPSMLQPRCMRDAWCPAR